MSECSRDYVRRVEPLAEGWRNHNWTTGSFDAGRRGFTPAVEGIIRTPDHVVLVTLNGGAEHLEVATDCGHRYSGPDRAGAVSFVPAHCERSLKLRRVASEWGSIALNPILFDDGGGIGGRLVPRPFSNVADRFTAALIAEVADISARDGGLDPVYCEAMSLALARHLVARFGERHPFGVRRNWKLPPWRLRRIAEQVEAKLEDGLRIADLAAIASLSPGYFHRAFKATTGRTPLEFINLRRVERAKELMRQPDLGLAAIALRVGFVSPSHFARTFRRIVGMNPSSYRAMLEVDAIAVVD